MKYRFSVETAYIKEIEIEASSEDEAWDKIEKTAYEVTYAPEDEACYDREIQLLDY